MSGRSPAPAPSDRSEAKPVADEARFGAERIRIAGTAFLLSLFLSFVYAASRIGFSPLPGEAIVEALSLAAILLLLPTSLSLALARRAGRSSLPWWASAASFTFAGLLLLLPLSLLPPPAPRIVLLVGGIASILLALAELRRAPAEARRLPRRSSLLALAALFVWIASVAWGSGQATPLWLENVVTGGVHVDVLFHAALANMIRTHGVASTGLDGLLPLPYHWGSHLLFGRMAEMLGRPVLEITALFHPVVLVPGLLAAMGLFVLELRRRLGLAAASGGLFWPLVAAAFLGVLPETALREMALDWNLHVVSESYLLGILGLFLLGSIAVAATGDGGGDEPKRAGFRIFALALLPFAFAILAVVKIPVGLLALPLAGYLGFRLGLLRNRSLMVGLGAGLALVALVLRGASSEGSPVVPFAFLREWVRPGWWPLLPFTYYGWGWLLALLRFRQLGLRSLDEVVSAFRDRRLLDVEAVACLAALGSVPGLVLAAPAGAAHYFSDLHRWLALPLLLALVEPELSRRLAEGIEAARRDRGNLAPGWIVATLLAAALVVTALGNLLLSSRSFVARNLEIRERIIRERDPSFDLRGGVKRALLTHEFSLFASLGARAFDRSIQGDLERCRDYPAVRLLLDLGARPASERSGEILYAPPESEPYWRLARRSAFARMFWSRCTPFVAPALAARPLLGALPSILPPRIDPDQIDRSPLDERGRALLRSLYVPGEGGAWHLDERADPNRIEGAIALLAPEYGWVFRWYGYPANPARRLPAPTGETGVEAAKREARRMGFRRLVLLETDGDRLGSRAIDLGGEAASGKR